METIVTLLKPSLLMMLTLLLNGLGQALTLSSVRGADSFKFKLQFEVDMGICWRLIRMLSAWFSYANFSVTAARAASASCGIAARIIFILAGLDAFPSIARLITPCKIAISRKYANVM